MQSQDGIARRQPASTVDASVENSVLGVEMVLELAERAKAAAKFVKPVAESLRLVSRNWTDEPSARDKVRCLRKQFKHGARAVERIEYAMAGQDGVIDAVFQCIGNRDKCASASPKSSER
jgi:hypothetical protein